MNHSNLKVNSQEPTTLTSEISNFRQHVIDGLSKSQKTLPSRFFYDTVGSQLFEQITEQETYYLTNSELEILEKKGQEISNAIGNINTLIEYGSGSSKKIRYLLKSLNKIKLYIPIDISKEILVDEAKSLSLDFPGITVSPINANFMEKIDLPDNCNKSPVVGFFPGSTIGNLTPKEAVKFLSTIYQSMPNNSKFLVGIDRKKDIITLLKAYDNTDKLASQ